MKLRNPFRALTRFEWSLWLCSLAVVAAASLLTPDGDWMSLIASLIGVTALIFAAKGRVLGQALIVVFAVFYGVISFRFHYYGEMVTYLGMSTPMAILAIVAWARHPFQDTEEVEVSRLTRRQVTVALAATAVVTVGFYFILGALHTTNLPISTVSVATSFFACSLTTLRTPWYAMAYAANDAVLIGMWILAARVDLAYLPMVFCFLVFLINDSYGFINWRRMKNRQEESAASED